MHDPNRQIFPEGSFNAAFGDQSSEFFEKIVSISPSILYVFDLVEMRNIWVNRSMFLGLGYSPDEVAEFGADLLPKLMHPDDMSRYPDHFNSLRTLAPDEVARFEYRMKAKNGTWHWLLSEEMAFSFSEDGKVTQIVGSAHDVSDARHREEKINLLVREMNHRIKNLFSVILSMISLTAKTKSDAPTAVAFDAILGRVNALAVSQSLSLASAGEAPTSSQQLVALVLKPYMATHDILISGSDPFLSSEKANSLAMVLHEMATNAIKYGALSTQGGQLFVDIETNNDTIEIIWTEKASFEVSQVLLNESTGFGSRLIERSIGQIDGKIELDWRATGLIARIKVPTEGN
jgi:PAS domain S-box-containing protein